MHEDEFTEEEIKRLKKIAANDVRMEWLWSNIRSIASWLAIVMGSMALGWEQIKKFIAWLARAVGG